MPVPTKLKEACVAIARQRGYPLPHLRERPLLADLVDTASLMRDMRPPDDPDKVAREIVAAVEGGLGLSKRQVRQAPWCFWSGGAPLCTNPKVAGAIIAAVRTAERPRPYRSLASAFLESFRHDLPGRASISHVLDALAQHWPSEHWSKLHQEYRLFDPDEGPRRLAEAVISRETPASELLSQFGVRAMGAKGGYAQAVTAALLQHLANGPDADHLERLAKVQRYALENGQPLLVELADDVAAAVLKPFGDRPPDQSTRDAVLNLLLGIFDDPRLRPSGRKLQLHPPFDAVVTRWLTDQSLRQFLDIVEQTTDKLEQFRYRRAFWWAAYEAGLIAETWVAFGRQGSALAKRAFGDNAPFAQLFSEGRQVDAGHAVLLMKIGTGVVADWSHSGMCNIWLDSNDPLAPKLYEPSYGSNSIRVVEQIFDDSRVAFSHTAPASYHWQEKKAGRYLFELTGRRLPRESYRLS